MLRRLMIGGGFVVVGALMTMVSSIQGQEDDPGCEALVETALYQAATNCREAGTNELCYGNALVLVQRQDESIPFAAPGDRVPLTAIEAMYTAPPVPQRSEWGLAVLDVQADTGSAAPPLRMMLFGGTDLLFEDLYRRDDAPVCTYTVDGIVNLRAGPSTTYNQVSQLEPGDSLPVYGRLDEWGRAAEGWVSLDFGTLDCPAGDLVEFELPAEAFLYPGQVFDLYINDPGACTTAPAGLILQTPPDRTANLLINGIHVRVNGTAYVAPTPDGELWLSNLSGAVGATLGSFWYPLAPATQMLISDGEVPVIQGIDGNDEARARAALIGLNAPPLSPSTGPVTSATSCRVGEGIDVRIELEDVGSISAVSVSDDGASLVQAINGVLLDTRTYSVRLNCLQTGTSTVTATLTTTDGSRLVYRYEITITE